MVAPAKPHPVFFLCGPPACVENDMDDVCMGDFSNDGDFFCIRYADINITNEDEIVVQFIIITEKFFLLFYANRVVIPYVYRS